MFRGFRLTIAVAVFFAAAVAGAVFLPVRGVPAPATRQVARVTLAPNACTRAYGQCWVTEYREHLRNGTVRIWTCFAQPPVKPGASNIWIAVNDCYRP